MMKLRLPAFTLLEVIVTVAILAILAAIVLVAVRPAQQSLKARNAVRQKDVRALMDAVYQQGSDPENKGVMLTFLTECSDTGDNWANFRAQGSSENTTLGSILVPHYLPAMPVDPA